MQLYGIIGYLIYLQNATLKVYLNGASNEQLKQLLVIEENGTVYFPIKNVASYLGYESYNGDYTDKSETQSKCYIQSEYEVANFSLYSSEVSKLDLTENNGNYEYIYSNLPVKAINGVLYAPAEMVSLAFNVSFEYNQKNNRIYIYTLPYLANSYASRVLDYGYTSASETFNNQKAILQNMIIVQKNDSTYGVIDTEGNIILEPKYAEITYLPEVGDFLVEDNEKIGVISKTRDTKIQIMYDSIELIDQKAGLYVVEDEGKYGVLDLNGKTRIHAEYDEIGIDISRFSQNGIKNKYLLADNLIPVKQEKLWGLFDTNGNQVVDFEYDSFGYIATSSKNAVNLLVIPDYNVIVACKDKKYILLNSSGEKLFSAVIADDIYMQISGGEKHYYITVNNNTIDAEAYLDQIGVKPESETNNASNNIDNTNSTNGTDSTANETNSMQTVEGEENQETNDPTSIEGEVIE